MRNNKDNKINNVVPLFENPKMRSPQELNDFMKENFPDVVVHTFHLDTITDEEIKVLPPFVRKVILREKNTK